MLRIVSRFNQPARRAVQTSGKSLAGAHNMQCRCGNCVQHPMGCTCPRCQSRSFSVKSQSHYDIPKTQTAVVFEKNNDPLQVRKDWPVTQPEDLKPGEWCVSFSEHVTPIPTDLPMHAAAPILCAGVTVYKALKEIEGSCGDFVVIPGAGGGLGHLACQYARAMGYRVIAIDSGDDKRKLVASYGIKDFIDFKEGNVKEKVFEATEGRGAHATVVVASGGEAYKDALSFLRPHGAVVLVGLPKDTYITAEVFGSVLNAHRIIGSYVGNRQDSIEALKLAAAGDVSTTYKVEKLENLPDVFERMADGKLAGRIVLDCE
ncbi:hypothetical protein PC119_g13329 [Phytophthora cactorum]|uniref:Enoyl reductase (ER) domain-containing protein n=1 Tax=Phytophthora cactorum TaxID=29920 RepID=A0A8T0YZ45_9STRA|nr:hypothetical protein PC113_g12889 [Phytophthora cactorum]KAG3011083.1 hypothetical protein PC119_g13329 [Phytophthora cactorum]